MKRFIPLATIALVLGAAAALGWLATSQGDRAGAWISGLAMLILLSLPAVAARMLGAPGLLTWLIAFLPPLAYFEIRMGIDAARISAEYIGGDLNGIEYDMMYVAGIGIFITASFVALIAVRCYPRPRD